MENVGVRRPGAPGAGRALAAGWWVVALVGAAAFRLADLAISLTPRILGLDVAIGLVARARSTLDERHRAAASRKERS
jgi:hypothetical protein